MGGNSFIKPSRLNALTISAESCTPIFPNLKLRSRQVIGSQERNQWNNLGACHRFKIPPSWKLFIDEILLVAWKIRRIYAQNTAIHLEDSGLSRYVNISNYIDMLPLLPSNFFVTWRAALVVFFFSKWTPGHKSLDETVNLDDQRYPDRPDL